MPSAVPAKMPATASARPPDPRGGPAGQTIAQESGLDHGRVVPSPASASAEKIAGSTSVPSLTPRSAVASERSLQRKPVPAPPLAGVHLEKDPSCLPCLACRSLL